MIYLKKIPIALQMYTLREECEQDFLSAFERVAKLGYHGVELAGYYDMPVEKIKQTLI